MKAVARPSLLLAGLLLLALVALALLEPARAEGPSRQLPNSTAPAAIDVQDLLFLGPVRPLVIRLHVTIDGKPFREEWQARFDELFGLEDRDGDGRVTVEEATSIVRDMNGGLRDAPQTDVSAIVPAAATGDRATGANDAKPALIDRALLLAHIEKTLPPFSVRRRAVVVRDSAAALFPLLDTDHDHQLSSAELAASEGQLKQRDFNDDGVITPGELILDPTAIAAAADPAKADRDLNVDEGVVMVIEATTTAEQIADRLLAHYDRNRDGRLSVTPPQMEVSLPVPLVGRLDANSDGVLDRQELGHFAEHRFDLELSFLLGRASAAESRRQQRVAVDEGLRVRKKLRDGYKL